MDRVSGLPIGPEHVVECRGKEVPLWRQIRKGKAHFWNGERELTEWEFCKLYCAPDGVQLFDFGNGEFVYAFDRKPVKAPEFIGRCFVQAMEVKKSAPINVGLGTKIFGGLMATAIYRLFVLQIQDMGRPAAPPAVPTTTGLPL